MAASVPVRLHHGHQPPRVWEPFTTQPWDADPAAQLRTLAERFFELASRAMGQWPDGMSWPLVELEEHDDANVLRLELPGVKRNDVEVELAGRRLTVRAERRQSERKGLLRRSTRRTGSYFFETLLPADLDPSDVEATLDAGVLTLRLPRPAERHRIKVGVR